MKAIAFYQAEATKSLFRLGADPNMTNEANRKNCLNKAYEYRNNDIINDIKLYSEKYFDICSYPQTYVLYKNEAASCGRFSKSPFSILPQKNKIIKKNQ